MLISENILRSIIRKCILEAKMRAIVQAGHQGGMKDENWKSKTRFVQKADQKSLSNLQYVHWGTEKEIKRWLDICFLKFDQPRKCRHEINTLIYPRGRTLEPWNLDVGETKYGIMVKGFVTFASNIDLDSGKIGWDEWMNHWEKQELGKLSDDQLRAYKDQREYNTPKRPNIMSMQQRMHAGLKGRERLMKGKKRNNFETLIIYKEKDLLYPPDLSQELKNLTQEWPEAIIDNWLPAAIVSPVETDKFSEYKIPIIDLSGNKY